jgi:GNAT superfamily N-acetyltransferase
MEYHLNEFTISTDKSRLNARLIHEYLSNTAYWSKGRSLETVVKSIEHSLCFGMYKDDRPSRCQENAAQSRQVGFARVVTDYATFAWLCDVFILDDYQGQGLGKWLVTCIISHPELASLRLILLATRDAHELYRKYGEFKTVDRPERMMYRRITDS